MTLLWKFLLAATIPPKYGLAKLPYPLYASPKIDGVRGGAQNGVVVSRNGRPIANREIQTRFGRPEYEGLDFEITDGVPYGEGVYNRAVRMTNKASADASKARLNVFGWYPCADGGPDSFCDVSTQLSIVADREANTGCKGVHIVKQTLIKNAAQLVKFEEKCLAQGYEGVMLRGADSPAYPQKPGKENRSTLNEGWLLRLKRFEYAECRLLAVHPLEHNANTERTSIGRRSSKKSGMVVSTTQFGSVDVVDTKSAATFSLTIPTNELRNWEGWRNEKLWKGKVVRYKFFPTGNVSAPRFPTAKFEELLP